MRIRIIRETIEKSGDKWVVKSKKGKTLGTHESEAKAKAQLAAIEINKNEEQLEEMSSVGGGGVQGYGAPLGDKKDNKKFNESEKNVSKLKGKKLAEMFSSSTQTGGLRISIVRGNKEHDGHVERAAHQGLRNVMREDDDATLPMDNTKPPVGGKSSLNTRDPMEELLENNGYELKKVLGQGQFGVVVLATKKDEYGGHDYAIKILKSMSSDDVFRELRNYNEISAARDKNPMIAKHFPEVFDIFEAGGKEFIVMEVLEPIHSELKGILGGVEQVMHKQRPMSAPGWAISKFDDDKDVSKRVEMILNDEKQIKLFLKMIKGQLATFSSSFGQEASERIRKDIDIALASTSFRNILSVSKEKGSELLNNFQNQISGYLGSAYKMYDAVMDDLKKSYPARIFVALVCKKIVDIMKKHSQQGQDYKSDSEYIINTFLERFQKHYRMSSSLKSGYSQADVGKKGGRMPDAESLYKAIMKLQEITGLFARDLHDGNAMKRPGGDIVIVDVGMFKTSDEIKQMKNRKLREHRIKIKIKR